MAVMQLLLIGGVGWVFYYVIWAIGWRAIAKLLQVSCYAISVAIVIQMVINLGLWFSNTTVGKFLKWIAR